MLRKLDAAMMCELNMYYHSGRKESKQSCLDVCQGIALSAFWLDLITRDDYLTISRVLDGESMRLQCNG